MGILTDTHLDTNGYPLRTGLSGEAVIELLVSIRAARDVVGREQAGKEKGE